MKSTGTDLKVHVKEGVVTADGEPMELGVVFHYDVKGGLQDDDIESRLQFLSGNPPYPSCARFTTL